MTTAICFDLDGTVVHLTKPYDSLLHETFETCLGHVDPAWKTRYSEQFFEYFRDIASEPYQKAMVDVCETFELSTDPETLTDELLEHEIAATDVNNDTRDVLTTLSQHYPLGIITNGVGHVQREKLARTGFDDLFDTVVVSYDIGAHKPDRKIFDAARDRLDGDTYVMVGDAYDADIVGARDARFEAVHIQNEEREGGNGSDRPTVEGACVELLSNHDFN